MHLDLRMHVCNSILFAGAVLFELHAFDIMNELSNILHDLNAKKIPLWMQMHFIEVLAAMLAERLMEHGTQIYINPDEIKWPDGTVSKHCESKGKGQKKEKKTLIQKMGYMAELLMSTVVGRKVQVQVVQVMVRML